MGIRMGDNMWIRIGSRTRGVVYIYVVRNENITAFECWELEFWLLLVGLKRLYEGSHQNADALHATPVVQ